MESDTPQSTASACSVERYLDAAEVKRRLDALSAEECWRLEQVARVYANGTGYSAADLLQEAFLAALDRRAWRADLETRVFLTSAMRSLAFSRRKALRVDALDAGLYGGEARDALIESISTDESDDPATVALQEQAQQTLLERLERLFINDAQVLRVIQGRALGESAGETRIALGVTESQYETICRRLLRGYQNSMKADPHE